LIKARVEGEAGTGGEEINERGKASLEGEGCSMLFPFPSNMDLLSFRSCDD